MQALGIEQKQFPINMIRSKISSAKNAMIGPEDMLKSADTPNDKKAAQVYLELERDVYKRQTWCCSTSRSPSKTASTSAMRSRCV